MESKLEGRIVAERYRLVAKVGAGGMGAIWAADDLSLDVRCALKLVEVPQVLDGEIRIRFDREARTAAQLRSPHVVDVFDHGEWEGLLFIAMEFLEGEDLDHRLERAGRLEPRETYEIVAQVARALMRAHALGIVHRDLKPENIFLVPGDEREIAKMVDFGIARHEHYSTLDKATKTGTLMGTPYYMSPEHLKAGQIDGRADLWSLAIIVFQCLTGRLPLEGDAVGELMAMIAQGPIPDLAEQAPWLNPAIGTWWKTATERDPALRFQSAKEFADALADALGIEQKLLISSAVPHRPPANLRQPESHHDGFASTQPCEARRPVRATRRRALRTVLCAGLCAGAALVWNALRERRHEPVPAASISQDQQFSSTALEARIPAVRSDVSLPSTPQASQPDAVDHASNACEESVKTQPRKALPKRVVLDPDLEPVPDYGI